MTVIGNITALASGVLFGLGLAVSHMVDPAKVLAFLDVTGNWDPSLAFVMAGAVLVTLIAFPKVLGRAHPLGSGRFAVPPVRRVDRRLVVGAAIFGVGWGLVGLCPGPAIASLAFAKTESLAFMVAMIVGLALSNAFPSAQSRGTSGAGA